MEASVATPGQGAPPAGTAPAGSQGDAGQGQPTAAGKGDGFNWGLFPDVPVEQRELLEPHLRNVQGHVTRIESQHAPYKGLTEAVPPNQVENLVGFLNGYNADPIATVLGMVQDLQQQGVLTPEHIAQITGQQQGTPAPGAEAQPEGEQIPEWAQQLQARLDQQDQQAQQEQAARESQEQEQMLDQAKTGIRAQLTQGGISEDLVSDEFIVSAIIANNGDEAAAANMLMQMRQNFLGAFTNDKTGGAKEPAVNGTLPGAPKKSGRPPGRDDFSEANAGAKAFLEQQARMAASG